MKTARKVIALASLAFTIGAFMCGGFKAVEWLIPSPPKTVTFKVTRS